MPDAGSPHTHPEDYAKMGLDFERDNAAITPNRGAGSPQLAEKVQVRIAMEGIEVEAFDSTVILSGIVADRYQREHAGSVAREVEGVAEVENRIRVQRSEAGGPVLTVRDPDEADEPANSRS